jgi:hypothetical protein
MKKLMTFIFLLVMPLLVYADSETIFSLNEIESSPGNNVTVILNMDNKQEFGVLTAKVHYDSTKLEYVSSQLKGLDAMLRGSDKNEETGIVAFYAINLSDKMMKDNGNVFLIEFKIKEDVTEDIPLELEIKDFGKDENTKLAYSVQNGLIKIKANVNTVEKNKSVDLTDELEKAIKENSENPDEKIEISWSSSNDDVATVDENGHVEFKKDGNVTIEAKDSEGNVIYSKDYNVKEKVSKNYHIKEIIIGVVIIGIIALIIVWRKKCKKRKK